MGMGMGIIMAMEKARPGTTIMLRPNIENTQYFESGK
jgi:hypothetical protein